MIFFYFEVQKCFKHYNYSALIKTHNNDNNNKNTERNKSSCIYQTILEHDDCILFDFH